MPLISRAHVRLSRLRFPFAVRVQAELGVACLRDATGRRQVRRGDPFVVPAFAHFGCELPGTPWQPSGIALVAVPDAGCPRMAAIQHDKPWSRALARLVFEHPAQAWNVALLSEHWQVCARQARARLFAEGEALHALVREQRAAWALYQLAMQDADTECTAETMAALAKRAGLRTARVLNETCANLFGVELRQLVATSAENEHATEPAGQSASTSWHLPLALTA